MDEMEEDENCAALRQACNMNKSPSPTDCLEHSAMMSTDKETLIKPNPLLLNLLKTTGAEKETFTMKEVIYHLGQYIMAKQLYDEKQQHIVHCSNDPLGELFGVQNFSVKEPRRLYAMISKNLVTADSEDCCVDTFEKGASTVSQTVRSVQDSAEELQEKITPSTSSPKKPNSESEENSSNGQPSEPQRKRHKSDSVSLTFDESLSWWVISGLRCDRNSSDSTDTSSNADHEARLVSGDSDWSDPDSDSDQFSVEFEVESVYSEDYSPSGDEESVTDDDDDNDDEVYQVTIYEAEESGDSFDGDTEISEADYWKCSQCDEMNPPIPRNCKRCWSLRKDWLPNQTERENCPLKRKEMESSLEDEGIDVPDGKKPKLSESQDSVVTKKDEEIQSSESQETEDFSQPSTSGSIASCSQEEYREGEQGHQESSERSLPLSSIEPCVICQTRPKNGCIVHGRTGHLMACFTCAKKLKRRNKPCPVCRQPIQMIVLTYFS